MTRDACAWSARDDVFEGYVRGALDAAERDAFENHYFECGTCLAKVRAYEGLRAEIKGWAAEAAAAPSVRPRPWRWALVPVAAGLTLVVAAALWLSSPAPAPPEPAVAVAPPAPTSPPAATQLQLELAPAKPSQSTPLPQAVPHAPSLVVALDTLARVEAAPYAPAELRGRQDAAAVQFETAMRLYVKRNYAGAIPGLEAAATLRPDVPPYAFFLGVCHLMTNAVDPAVLALQKAIALGESPYLEEAHYYLAKAKLRQGDIPAARAELKWVIERQGRLEADARRLLAQLDALVPRR